MIEVALQKKLNGAGGHLNLDFAASVAPGERIGIYGPSGAGKTSVLRMIAGLLKPDSGHIVVGGHAWFDDEKKINIKPQLRSIGMVFQEYSLFPNMTVRENLAYALENGQSPTVVDDLLRLTELDQLQNQRPGLLSGGQKQRVALARALVRRPQIMLLDEPLSALDSAMRKKLQDYILTMHAQFNFTMLLVSHDVFEVSRMCTRVVVVEDGMIKKDGPPSELFPPLYYNHNL